MNIKEAVEKLKETAKQCRNSKECWENEDCCDCYVEVEDIFAIETVLAELEKKDKEIERYKMMLAETHARFLNSDLKTKRKNDEDLEMLNNGWKLELEKKDRIINKMAERLTTDIHSKEWVIDYYEREVEK